MKSIYRKLMNRELEEPLAAIEGKVLDLASGGWPSYRKFLPPEKTEIIAADLRLPGAGSIDFNKRLPYKDGEFDAVLLINAIYIAKDPVATLREARRVLKTGGTLVLVSPFVFPEAREPHDYFRWTSEGVEHALKNAGFDEIDLRPFGGYFTSALYIIELMLYFRALKFLAQWLARALDRLVPQRLTDAHPCPIGYAALCKK